MAYETIEKEATEQDKDFINHTKHLILHGILHILGYDHILESQANEMESLEINSFKTVRCLCTLDDDMQETLNKALLVKLDYNCGIIQSGRMQGS